MDNISQISQQDPSDALEKRSFWEREVLAQKESGKTMEEFCRERQLSPRTFRYHKYQKWNRKTKDGSIKKTHKEIASKFIPLQIISNNPPVNEADKNSDVKIIFKNGHSVVMPASDLDAAFFIIKKVAGL